MRCMVAKTEEETFKTLDDTVKRQRHPQVKSVLSRRRAQSGCSKRRVSYRNLYTKLMSSLSHRFREPQLYTECIIKTETFANWNIQALNPLKWRFVEVVLLAGIRWRESSPSMAKGIRLTGGLGQSAAIALPIDYRSITCDLNALRAINQHAN